MIIILLGAPGAGKGTQAQYISQKYNIPHISTGDILRNWIKNKSKLVTEINILINSGKLISDKLITKLVKKRISLHDCHNGFLLDGFPRTINQAKAIQNSGLKIDFVLELLVPDSIVIDRIYGRLIHPASGRIYHKKFFPPKEQDRDDITHEVLISRKDDKQKILIKRLITYHKEIKPLRDYYLEEANSGKIKFFSIDGNTDLLTVSSKLSNIIDTFYNT